MKTIFVACDRNNFLSILLADPHVLYEPFWPHKKREHAASESPWVSIIVATRNNAATIKKALDSLRTQTFTALEIIVINDASEDETGRIAHDIAHEDSRIIVLDNAHRLGTGASRNKGMALARGHYITFQDGDDVSAPTRIERQVDALTGTGKTLALCNYARVNSCGDRLVVNERRLMKCIISMMFPREEVLAKVGYFIHSTLSEDADYYERIKIAFGRNCEVIVFRTLYEAGFSPDSSFFSEMEIQRNDGQVITYRKTQAADAQWETLKALHAQMRAGKAGVYVACDDRVIP